jgi:hypothetical protein
MRHRLKWPGGVHLMVVDLGGGESVEVKLQSKDVENKLLFNFNF